MKFNREKIIPFIPHIIGLFFIAMIPMFIFNTDDTKVKLWTYRFYYQLFFFVIAFYGNYFLIVPRYFFSHKKIKFYLTLLIFAVSLLTVSQVVSKKFEFFKPPIKVENDEGRVVQTRVRTQTKNSLGLHPRILDDTFFIILIFGFSTGMSILQKLHKDDQTREKLEKANIENELAFLKNQINPHFFFNSLNNIYALIDIDGAQAQKSIETLSGLMRYLIYESDSKKVPLRQEFDFSRNYIALMKQRLSSKVKLNVEIDADIPELEIPPLLFIALIENAFKHGVSYRGNSFIDIKMKIENKAVLFQCKNSIPDSNDSQNHKPGGLGITNLKKRLDILYGENAQLTINDSENIFDVQLTIPL
jgi:hypothetical protein